MNSSSNTQNESVEISSTEYYASKNSNKKKIIIIIVSAALAFAFWCYAGYKDDPIISKTMVVQYTLYNGEANERLSKEFQIITVHGRKSVLDQYDIMPIGINRNSFDIDESKDGVEIQYNTDRRVNINTNDWHTHDEIYLKLIKDDTSSDK